MATSAMRCFGTASAESLAAGPHARRLLHASLRLACNGSSKSSVLWWASCGRGQALPGWCSAAACRAVNVSCPTVTMSRCLARLHALAADVAPGLLS